MTKAVTRQILKSTCPFAASIVNKKSHYQLVVKYIETTLKGVTRAVDRPRAAFPQRIREILRGLCHGELCRKYAPMSRPRQNCPLN
jgi:hypothetical protein